MVIQGVSYPSDFEAKKAIIELAKQLEQKGFLVAGDGSISVRVGPTALWITQARAPKATLTQEMLVRVDLNGKQMLSGRNKPLPEELPIHLGVYQENETARCVIHAYPFGAVMLGLEGQELPAASYTPAVRSLGRVSLVCAAGFENQAQAVRSICRGDKAVILRDNGCVAWGASPVETCQTLEVLEYSYQIHSRMGACKRPSVTNMETMVSVPTVESVALTGVTGWIKPGAALPPLPQENADTAAVTETPSSAASVSTAPSAQMAAVDVPKSDVMAEVVRRTMQSFR